MMTSPLSKQRRSPSPSQRVRCACVPLPADKGDGNLRKDAPTNKAGPALLLGIPIAAALAAKFVEF